MNYPAHKLEFLCLKWAVTNKFHEYLYGNKFTVFTDNNPLTYVLSSVKLDAVGHCWVAALAVYNFSLVYKQGCFNQDADALSLIHWPSILKELDHEVISAACQVVSEPSIPVMDTLSLSEALINEHFDNPMMDGLTQMIQDNDWAIVQDQDPALPLDLHKFCLSVHKYIHIFIISINFV